jgi:hypothetical protein
VLGGGLVLGGSDDEPEGVPEEERDNQDRIDLDKPLTSTTERRTTTTTTLAPLGPIFGEPIDGALLIHRAGSTWSRLDLTTGAIELMSLPDVDLFNAEVVPGGIAIAAGEEVRYYPVLGDDLEPEGALLGNGNQVMPAGPDRLWLFDQPGTGDEVNTQARLVDLEGTVLREVEVPGYETYATADEVLVSRGGRVYVVEDPGYRPLATGYLNGVVGQDALVTTCDDDAACSLQLQPTDGGPTRTIAPIDDPEAVSFAPVSAASDGRVAVVVHTSPGTEQRLLLFDPRDGEIDEVEVSLGMQGGSPQWLPGDHGLLTSTTAGLLWVRPRGDGWVVEELDIPQLGFPETFFFVTP